MAEIDINNEHELLSAGYDALINALGVGGFLKFMGHFHGGTGDYTAEKYDQPEMSFPEIMAGIERMHAEYAKFKAAQTPDDAQK